MYVEFNCGYDYLTKNGGNRARFITKIYSNQTSPWLFKGKKKVNLKLKKNRRFSENFTRYRCYFWKFLQMKKRGRAILTFEKVELQFVSGPYSLVTQRQQQTCNCKTICTKVVSHGFENCFFLNPTLSNVYSTIFMWDGFLTALKLHLISLKTNKFVRMDLNLHDG